MAAIGIYRNSYNRIAVKDEHGIESELPIRLYELQGCLPSWETLPTEAQWRDKQKLPKPSPRLPR
jgi:hypothetical protein